MGSEENENVTREILIKRKVCMVHLLSVSLKEALLNSQKWLIKMKRGELFKKWKMIPQQEPGVSFDVLLYNFYF